MLGWQTCTGVGFIYSLFSNARSSLGSSPRSVKAVGCSLPSGAAIETFWYRAASVQRSSVRVIYLSS